MKPKPEHTDLKKQQIVFLCDTPRSGTSALTNMLNTHPEIFIGMERFHKIIISRQLKKEHFDCNRFIKIMPGDTHQFGGLNKQGEALFNYNKAKVLGEKMPKLFQHYDYIFKWKCPYPAREGDYVDYKFPFGSSGLFGEATEGEWKSYESVKEEIDAYWNRHDGDATKHGWYDLHAKYYG